MTKEPSPKSILILTCVLKNGGAEKRLRYLTEYLRNAGVKIHLYALYGNSADCVEGVECHFLNWKSEKDYGHVIREIRRAIKASSVDVVMGWSSFMNLVCAISCIGLKSKPRLILQECHQKAPLWKFWRIKHFTIELLSLLLYRTADKIIFNSQPAMALMRRSYRIRPEKMCCINNPIDYEKLAAANYPVPSEYAGLKRPIVLFVGRLVALKRVHLLFDAWMQLPESERGSLVYVGSGPQAESLRMAACRHGVSESVVLAGFQDNPYPYIRHADVLVLQSRHEGLPNVVLEALALRTPVVTTDCCHMVRELSEAGGSFLCPSAQPADLARLIRQALKPECAESMRNRGYDFLNRFQPEQVLQEQKTHIFGECQ